MNVGAISDLKNLPPVSFLPQMAMKLEELLWFHQFKRYPPNAAIPVNYVHMFYYRMSFQQVVKHAGTKVMSTLIEILH